MACPLQINIAENTEKLVQLSQMTIHLNSTRPYNFCLCTEP